MGTNRIVFKDIISIKLLNIINDMTSSSIFGMSIVFKVFHKIHF